MVSIYTQSNSIALSQEFPPIHIQGLYKHYGKTAAVRGIDLNINRGELFGLIGSDGAGKTTIFHILGGVMEATAGKVQILGQTPRKVRNAIGYLTQQFSLYLDLSVDENLRYSASLRQVSDRRFQQQRQKYLKLMQLDRFGDRLAGKLSGGMKQKLALCCALISEPKVLLLDEPTTGVDTVARREFWDILAGLTAQGITIIVATPDLDEAERCDRIALLYDGQIKQMGTPKQLKDALNLHRLEIYTSELAKADRLLLDVVQASGDNRSNQIIDVQVLGDRIDVLVRELETGEAEVRSLFAKAQIPDPTIRQSEPTLENVFVNLIRSQGAIPKFVVFPRQRQIKEITNPEAAAIAIHARQLNRTFGNFHAVQDLNLEIRYGEVYGLLGANGAGKTTATKMLCGLLPISSGEISLGGEKGNLRSADLRQRIGYMSQKFTLYDDLTIIAGVQLGLAIAIFTSTQSAAVQGIGTIKVLTAFLLAGFLFPLNTVPFPFSIVSYAVPARYYIELCRDAFVRGSGWSGTWHLLLAMTLLAIAEFGLAWLGMRRMQLSD